eukprot:758767-Amphidinium_carterae.1
MSATAPTITEGGKMSDVSNNLQIEQMSTWVKACMMLKVVLSMWSVHMKLPLCWKGGRDRLFRLGRVFLKKAVVRIRTSGCKQDLRRTVQYT